MKKSKSDKKAISLQARDLAQYTYEWINIHVPTLKTSSCHTERAYRLSLRLFTLFLETVKHVDIFSLTTACYSVETLNEWRMWLKNERNASNSTCNNRMSVIKSLLEYIGGKNMAYSYLYLRAAEHLRPLKEPQKKIKGMTRDAVQAIFAVPDTNTRIGLRDLTLMMLSYGVAARIDEILSLTIRNVHLDAKDPFVLLLGKGNKIRSIYLESGLVEWLRRYIEVFHGKNPSKGNFLFYSPCHGNKNKLTQPAISKRLKLYAEKAHQHCEEVPLNLHSHLWRHSMACHWREDNINIVEIKELMGHSRLESTMIYQDVTEEQKKAAIETLEDTVTKSLERKWKMPENKGLAAMFGLDV
ncbi:tyrosine-type recombinase/integrase [Bacteroides sp. 519]|uniref:tyrosine-type recombinase/integrase n=1 Tax=Bacteroides sp. 519 TaxID=2302937 RepID=UPI0013D75087|nr:tyrosine-type recombinase/integrase [Bacteroides sp. 519]